MRGVCAVLTQIAEGIWRRAGNGRRLAIVAGVHGDERAGIIAVRALLDPQHPIWSRVTAEVTLVVANLKAVEARCRSVDSEDMNRLFGRVTKSMTGARVACIQHALKDVGHVLDLHETSCDSEPLAVCDASAPHLAAVARLGLNTIVADAPRVLGPGMLSAWVDRHGGCGVTVEVGRNGTSEAEEWAHRLVERWLLDDSVTKPWGEIRVWHLTEVIVAREDKTRLIRTLGNASRVQIGEVLARGPNTMIPAPGDGGVFLPKSPVDKGQPIALFAIDGGLRSAPYESRP